MKDLMLYYSQNSSYVFSQFIRHFLISIYGVFFAALVAIPLGFLVARNKRLSDLLVGLANILQTVPSLAMLAILMFILGIGADTVVFVVFLYSILPILKNTIAGILAIPEDLMDAAKGMGMTQGQIMVKIELPLALSVIMGGIRNALVVGIGVTAVGTFIGAGGLGAIITRGINVAKGGPIILAGAIPTALMAVITDFILSGLESKLAPRTLKRVE